MLERNNVSSTPSRAISVFCRRPKNQCRRSVVRLLSVDATTIAPHVYEGVLNLDGTIDASCIDASKYQFGKKNAVISLSPSVQVRTLMPFLDPPLVERWLR